ncbi:hypothetical protein BDK92_1399 [Micromonospora pisi]|uniref:Uncharacterized protein n=1 Tax=Micromonospora pisi TaxID=589240 RepID=A0A495JDP7_9ACTN|nr:hypothetical protein [Micromonospora pisi]RKR87126.1 hypothetical protein BDK92_1399 [Micromonospora pisi]
MNALSETYYRRYAQTRLAEARQTIDRHAVCAYTGVCLGCGRPGPCADRTRAQETLARYSHPPNRSHRWAEQTADTTRSAIRTADGTVEPLRAACLAATEAVERAGQQLDGVEHELARTALANWDNALVLGWESLTTVYAGLAEARQLPGAEPPQVGDVLAGLRQARLDAGRAAREIDRVRQQLTTAEDRLRRAYDDPRARAAARSWAVAGRRLDLVAARLALGTRALERYAANLAGTPEPATLTVDARLHRLLARARPSGAQTRDGARSAALLLLRRHPFGGWRGFLARLRQNAWKEFIRPWTA